MKIATIVPGFLTTFQSKSKMAAIFSANHMTTFARWRQANKRMTSLSTFGSRRSSQREASPIRLQATRWKIPMYDIHANKLTSSSSWFQALLDPVQMLQISRAINYKKMTTALLSALFERSVLAKSSVTGKSKAGRPALDKKIVELIIGKFASILSPTSKDISLSYRTCQLLRSLKRHWYFCLMNSQCWDDMKKDMIAYSMKGFGNFLPQRHRTEIEVVLLGHEEGSVGPKWAYDYRLGTGQARRQMICTLWSKEFEPVRINTYW